ncbi:MAG: putative toxin-antitoxin system toxin component, PIN family [Flectobacillus sp.]|jgi:putative PIN family toxin of toxin-antitoxin system|nr:putative toxin-antitoxin system toxin component, PIN family [Flectobacillus sp.]
MRVVIDTNCLIASIPANGDYFWLYLAFRTNHFTWVVSTEILEEYEEQLSEFYSPETADIVLKILTTAPNVEFAVPYFRLGLMTNDPDDNKFADLAISTNAHYLVSNDRHFNIFKDIKFPPLNIVNIQEFKGILNLA